MFEMFLTVFWMLLIGHAVADYPLQTDFMSVGKNRNLNGGALNGVPWYYIMGSHCLVHAGMVTILTGSVILGALEFVLHYVIDILKCEKYTNIHHDQLLHVVCKVAWAAYLASQLVP